jgi:hypothetical protein
MYTTLCSQDREEKFAGNARLVFKATLRVFVNLK